MLEGLETVSWSDLKHANGMAGDVPGLLRALPSPDEATRARAADRLFGNICHQGTAYEASSHAVPFLQELLRGAETPDKTLIASILAEMGNSYSDIAAASASKPMESLLRQALAREGRDFDQELSDSLRYAQETRQAVGRDLPLLFPYLTCSEADVREAVARALSNHPERADMTLPLLRSAIAVETEEGAKAAMHEAIGALEGMEE